MSHREAICTDAAPAAIGPYSQAIRVGSTVWLSGQIALEPSTMTLVGETAADQARQALQNLGALGTSPSAPFFSPI